MMKVATFITENSRELWRVDRVVLHTGLHIQMPEIICKRPGDTRYWALKNNFKLFLAEFNLSS